MNGASVYHQQFVFYLAVPMGEATRFYYKYVHCKRRKNLKSMSYSIVKL